MSGVADCERYNTMISTAVDGQLEIGEKLELNEHLKTCAECRSYSELMERIHSALSEEEAEPPEKLADGIMYKVELASSRRRFRRGTWGRYTVAAAVICLAVLGAARLAPVLKGSGAAKHDSAAAGGEPYAAPYTDTEGAERNAGDEPQEPPQSPKDTGETFNYVYEAAGAPAAAADMSADGTDTLRGSGATKGAELYRAAKNAYGEKFYETAIIFGQEPQRLWDCEILYSAEGRTDYKVPLEIMLELELDGCFDEIYFDDLMADYGLVIAIAE